MAGEFVLLRDKTCFSGPSSFAQGNVMPFRYPRRKITPTFSHRPPKAPGCSVAGSSTTGQKGSRLNRPRLNIRRSEPLETDKESRHCLTAVAAAASHPTRREHSGPSACVVLPDAELEPLSTVVRRCPLVSQPLQPHWPFWARGLSPAPGPSHCCFSQETPDSAVCPSRLLSGVLSPGTLVPIQLKTAPPVPLCSLLCFVYFIRNPLPGLYSISLPLECETHEAEDWFFVFPPTFFVYSFIRLHQVLVMACGFVFVFVFNSFVCFWLFWVSVAAQAFL